MTIEDAIKSFPNACHVISIGVGYAFDSEKFNLGDVLVSKQICDFNNMKVRNDDRGQRIDVVKRLFSIFCMNLTHEEDFLVSEERSSRVSAGQFVALFLLPQLSLTLTVA